MKAVSVIQLTPLLITEMPSFCEYMSKSVLNDEQHHWVKFCNFLRCRVRNTNSPLAATTRDDDEAALRVDTGFTVTLSRSSDDCSFAVHSACICHKPTNHTRSAGPCHAMGPAHGVNNHLLLHLMPVNSLSINGSTLAGSTIHSCYFIRCIVCHCWQYTPI